MKEKTMNKVAAVAVMTVLALANNACTPVQTELASVAQKPQGIKQPGIDPVDPGPAIQPPPIGSNPPKDPTTPPVVVTPPNPTTPPINCAAQEAQYKGVVPVGKDGSGQFITKRFEVREMKWPKVVFNYPISSEAQRQLDQMHGDVGWQLTMGLRGPNNWNRIQFLPNTVYTYKIKTTEYNFPSHYTIAAGGNPLTAQGTLMTSISRCPGSFISPDVLAQKSGYDHYNTGNIVGDQKFRNCLTNGPPLADAGGLNFGIGGNTQYICALEPNTTYYLNFTVGSMQTSGAGPQFPYLGDITPGTQAGETYADMLFYPFGHQAAAGYVGNKVWTTPIVKNREEFYAEAIRVNGLFQQAAQARVQACAQAIASAPGPRTGNECSSIPLPMGPYHFEF